jgi:hypothetical protein
MALMGSPRLRAMVAKANVPNPATTSHRKTLANFIQDSPAPPTNLVQAILPNARGVRNAKRKADQQAGMKQ